MKDPQLGFIVVLVVAVYLLYPFPQTVAPEWTVTTLDASRRPLANITVQEVWQQYSLEKDAHREDRLTDADGRVEFPRRLRRSSYLRRALGCLWRVANTGGHASCGADAILVASGDGVDTMDWRIQRKR